MPIDARTEPATILDVAIAFAAVTTEIVIALSLVEINRPLTDITNQLHKLGQEATDERSAVLFREIAGQLMATEPS